MFILTHPRKITKNQVKHKTDLECKKLGTKVVCCKKNVHILKPRITQAFTIRLILLNYRIKLHSTFKS